MVNAGLIIVTFAFLLVMILVNTYLFVLFCHSEEKQVGSHVLTKLLVILGFTLAAMLVMELPLDVANYHVTGELNMEVFTAVIQSTAAVYLSILAPFAVFFYETDEDQSLGKRLLSSFLYTGVAVVCSCALLFISYSFLGVTNSGVRVTVLVYMIALMSAMGWVLLVLFGGAGLIFLPLDLISDFINRPKPLTTEQAKEKKELLLEDSTRLCEDNKSLTVLKQQLQKQQGWWNKRKAKARYEQAQSKFRDHTMMLMEDYQRFQKELNFTKDGSIVAIAWAKLFLGILAAFMSLAWWLQILLGSCIVNNGQPASAFMGALFNTIEQSGAGIVGAVLFALVTFYLLMVYLKGSVRLAQSVPLIFGFHPMVRNQTFLNSLIFNTVQLILGGCGIMQLVTTSFSSYSKNSYLYNLFLTVNELRMYSFLYGRNVFPISLLVMTGVTGITLIIKRCWWDKRASKSQKEAREDHEQAKKKEVEVQLNSV